MVGWAWARAPVQTVAPGGTSKYSLAQLLTHRLFFTKVTFAQPDAKDGMGSGGLVTCSPDSCVMLGLGEHSNAQTSQMKTLVYPCLLHQNL